MMKKMKNTKRKILYVYNNTFHYSDMKNLNLFLGGIKEYFADRKNKIFTFHGHKNGKVRVPLIVLLFYYLLSYKFFCCYSKQVKEQIKFGDFVYGFWDKQLTLVSNNRTKLIRYSLHKEKKLSKHNRHIR